MGLVTLYFAFGIFTSRSFFAGAGIFFILAELPILPIFLLLGFLFNGLSPYFGETVIFISLHLISWVLGGILYFFIFNKIINSKLPRIIKSFFIGIAMVVAAITVSVVLFIIYQELVIFLR